MPRSQRHDTTLWYHVAYKLAILLRYPIAGLLLTKILMRAWMPLSSTPTTSSPLSSWSKRTEATNMKRRQRHTVDGIATTVEKKNTALVLQNGTTHCEVIAHSTLYSPPCSNLGVGTPRRLLVTGVGRSGTAYLVQLLRHAGLHLNHDNNDTPAMSHADGSVSWAHAFNDQRCPYQKWMWRRRRRLLSLSSNNTTSSSTQTRPKKRKNKNKEDVGRRSEDHDRRYFLHVLHLVRDPLKTLTSRWNLGKQMKFIDATVCNTETLPKSHQVRMRPLHQTLQHWVLWNSFVESIAHERINLEQIDGSVVHDLYHTIQANPPAEGHHATAALHDVPLLHSIKTKEEIDDFITQHAHAKINSKHTHKVGRDLNWDHFMKVDKEFTIMAQMMTKRYGYTITGPDYTTRAKYRGMRQVCGFSKKKRWTCHLKPYDA